MTLRDECIDMVKVIAETLGENELFNLGWEEETIYMIEQDTGVFLCPVDYEIADGAYSKCDGCKFAKECSRQMVKTDLKIFFVDFAGDRDGGEYYINFCKRPMRSEYIKSIYYINNRRQLRDFISDVKMRIEEKRNEYAEYGWKTMELRDYGREFLHQLQKDFPVFNSILDSCLPLVFHDFRVDENGKIRNGVTGDFCITGGQLVIHIYNCWRNLESLKETVRHEILHYVLYRIGLSYEDDSPCFHYFCSKYDGGAYKDMTDGGKKVYKNMMDCDAVTVNEMLKGILKKEV